MGQLAIPQTKDILLTAVDRLTASNIGGGIDPAASHLVIFGENAGTNLGSSNVIAIGQRALSGGFAAGSGADFSTVVGENSFPGPADLTTGALGAVSAVTIIGGGNLSQMAVSRRFAGLIMLGAGNMADFVGTSDGGMDRSVFIGNGILKNNSANNALASDNIFIGYRVCARGLPVDSTQYIDNVFIGSLCGPQGNTINSIVGNTVIGSKAAQGMMNPSADNTIVGRMAGGISNGLQNTIIGSGAGIGPNGNNNIAIGYSCSQGAGDDNTYVGTSQTNAQASSRNIFLGRGAGNGATVGTSDQFIVETVDGTTTRRTMFFGDMNNGNLIVGKSTPAVDRDTRGTNTLKLLNGGKGAGNPVGGGFFYVNAGALHWVGSAGTDTVIAPA